MPEVVLPSVFDTERESSKFLARMKRRASKGFRWTRLRCLENAEALAYWLYVFGEDGQALEVCRFLGQSQLSGDTRLWSKIEGSLALQSRLLRQKGKASEAAECAARIRTVIETTYSPGVPDKRMAGAFLHNYERDAAYAASNPGMVGLPNKAWETSFRLMALIETCTLIELGGSAALPVPVLEDRLLENATRLRELSDAAGRS